ncbi:MAG: TraR/DksA family transcriptional regulator [Pirellulaceae bacterium]
MSDAGIDIASLKTRLIEQREALLDVAESSREAAQTVELDQSRMGRVSRMDAMQAQAMAKESDRRRLLALQRIKGALQRIEDGEYGHCVACDEPITASRLEVDPGALLCIDCASKAERDA